MTTIPITIGGRTALIEKPETDHCSASWCNGEVVATCGFNLLNSSKTCGKPLCEQHAHLVQVGKVIVKYCPAHQRKADQEQGKVRLVP